MLGRKESNRRQMRESAVEVARSSTVYAIISSKHAAQVQAPNYEIEKYIVADQVVIATFLFRKSGSTAVPDSSKDRIVSVDGKRT
mmetsp:Transcript_21138/g.32266  ORF Transcript_21138/g.32266 Transcript_21138/m.32266 type:complete len:85 (+) Transcript_21138:150-404(+)